jgi:hypothetical protein
LKLLRSKAPRFWDVAEVVGKWAWITFTEKQSRQVTMTLSELGFHWNNIRQCWHCQRICQQPACKRVKNGSAELERISLATHHKNT